MSIIEGTIKVQFTTKKEINAKQLKEIQEELYKIVEASSSELEEVLDCLNIDMESIDPITICDPLEVME
jgi:DNA replication initiation complex subunit (GINS family)